MKKKIYFAGSIRGGRSDASLYQEIIAFINETDTVLTEQVGDLSHSVLEQARDKDEQIYLQDISWLRVGYELAYAEKYNKPVHVFYRPDETSLSAMIKGDRYYSIHPYHTKEEMKEKICKILERE